MKKRENKIKFIFLILIIFTFYHFFSVHITDLIHHFDFNPLYWVALHHWIVWNLLKEVWLKDFLCQNKLCHRSLIASLHLQTSFSVRKKTSKNKIQSHSSCQKSQDVPIVLQSELVESSVDVWNPSRKTDDCHLAAGYHSVSHTICIWRLHKTYFINFVTLWYFRSERKFALFIKEVIINGRYSV